MEYRIDEMQDEEDSDSDQTEMMHLHGEASSNAGSQLSKKSGLKKKFKSEITPLELVQELQQHENEKSSDNRSSGEQLPTMQELVD